MGCGKSSVGRELAGLLSLPFVDLDGYIESREGRSVREIFAGEGEAAFRKMELEVLKEILYQEAESELGYAASSETADEMNDVSPTTEHQQTRDMVLALGGGTLTTPECAELVAEHTFCIFLKVSAEKLFARLENGAANRPMLRAANPETNAGDTETGVDALPNLQPSSSESSSHNSIEDIPDIPSEPPGQQLRRRIISLLSQREPIYEATARLTIVTDDLSVKQTAAAIAELLD